VSWPQKGPERPHQLGGFQQHEPPDRVGRADDQGAGDSAQVPTRGGHLRGVGGVVEAAATAATTPLSASRSDHSLGAWRIARGLDEPRAGRSPGRRGALDGRQVPAGEPDFHHCASATPATAKPRGSQPTSIGVLEPRAWTPIARPRDRHRARPLDGVAQEADAGPRAGGRPRRQARQQGRDEGDQQDAAEPRGPVRGELPEERQALEADVQVDRARGGPAPAPRPTETTTSDERADRRQSTFLLGRGPVGMELQRGCAGRRPSP
jgi:hypothetical protein